jgi:hypothetical protein
MINKMYEMKMYKLTNIKSNKSCEKDKSHKSNSITNQNIFHISKQSLVITKVPI